MIGNRRFAYDILATLRIRYSKFLLISHQKAPFPKMLLCLFIPLYMAYVPIHTYADD